MFFGIYGRKSVYSDKSDSVDNQHRMCNDYIQTHNKKVSIHKNRSRYRSLVVASILQ